MDKVILVISDCHLSAGRFFENRLNPHEDFNFDEDMCDLIEHFSTGRYGSDEKGPVEVELFIDGDFFDFLNVPIRGEFIDAITEEVSTYKIDAILKGHPKVMSAFRRFCTLPGKSISYLIGNHDADLFFPAVRERIIRAWDPEGAFPSSKVTLIADRDRVAMGGGLEIHHGNQWEPGNELDFARPFVERGEKKLLNLPWGSIYVLKIINRLKTERDYLDKIRPIKAFLFFGIIFDPLFTFRYMFLSAFYFVATRLTSPFRAKRGLRNVIEILREELNVFQDLERPARKLLDENPEIRTIIFGHTHRPMDRIYPDGKQYINTGTWTKMIDLDWRGLGQQFRRTFAYVEIKDGVANCELREWVGFRGPHKTFGR